MRSRLALLAAALVLTACHSSRYAGNYHSRLHQKEATSISADTEKAVAPPVVEDVGGKYAAARTPLQRSIDDILSADTITQTAQVAVCVYDVTADRLLYDQGSQQRMRPASTEKVVTAIAALDLLGPDYTLCTQLLSAGTVKGHTLQGDLYVRGVMDPLLGAADVRTLAARLKETGITRIEGRLLGDASFKDADELGWGWCWDDDNPTLSPLLCGGKPLLLTQLQSALHSLGITVSKGTATGTAPAAARPLATFCRPLTDVLQPMMKESDNLCAEAVFYHIAANAPTTNVNAKSYSRRRAAAAISQVIAKSRQPHIEGLDMPYTSIANIADGSGLSLYNYQTAETFIRLLNYAARSKRILPALWEALPIAAVDGTLKKRMAGTPAAATVRAKTGSVSAVSTLVGYTLQPATNHLIAFAILTQGVQQMAQGRNLQDRICILLSSAQP